MSTTTTIAFLVGGVVLCPECHEMREEEELHTGGERLCRRDVELGTNCEECGGTIVADPDDAVRERPNAWDEGGKEEWKEIRS